MRSKRRQTSRKYSKKAHLELVLRWNSAHEFRVCVCMSVCMCVMWVRGNSFYFLRKQATPLARAKYTFIAWLGALREITFVTRRGLWYAFNLIFCTKTPCSRPHRIYIYVHPNSIYLKPRNVQVTRKPRQFGGSDMINGNRAPNRRQSPIYSSM